ncbi:hypothetical protein ACFOD0_10805 [Shewanella intestini]|uniref:DUF2531 family protein n=1 Tax=Shewanella intestini TaxID=2017544 RepID=A0ABS5I3P1_9GAMM|nr:MULTISPECIES: hypothetical protein [Shewanella]MBR9728634.1 hypothetical protein [Shewanella intestini]MRG37310.1 hypothetical protein [Shewanella sp. XMDDZSB0408]
MALSRKKWNNIIIAASVIMISLLSYLDRKTQQLPDDALPLFDDASPIAQLQLNNVWLKHQPNNASKQWQCATTVLNCQLWAQAWQQIYVSPLSQAPQLTDTPKELLIQVTSSPQVQRWQFFVRHGLLKSASGNWYQIPPSLRDNLLPIIDLSAKS